MKNTDKGNTVEMMIRVFVTNENPVDAIQDAYIPGVSKDFDSLDKAEDFMHNMLAYGLNVSLNAWNEE
ncbi:MAG: hypothetical protein Q4C83_03430 [Candidatus Saccharibacteria bacterium]|nr:hypothetical protein [Candidatus Saccharibacteria bacterium]